MKYLACTAWMTLIVAQVSGQETPAPSQPAQAYGILQSTSADTSSFFTPVEPADGMKGNTQFQNFIGFISDPIQNIDPRSMTAIWPIFGHASYSTVPALPGGEFQIYGAGIYVALSDRFSMGLSQGGYVVANVDRNRPGLFRDRLGALQDRARFDGSREGFLNLGGFFQYTLIEDVPEQFLLTAGLRWVAPCGSHEVFQGIGPASLAPYFTFGKEFGKFHVLGTAGYQFPVGGGTSLSFFNANLHLDRQFGRFYPLVEFNTIYHTANVDVSLPSRLGFFDFSGGSASGNLVNMAAGANFVLVPNRVEFGAVYISTIASQRHFDMDGLIAKMVLRF